MKLNAFAAVALFVGLVFASSAHSQLPRTGGPTPSPAGAKIELLDLKDGAVIGPKTTIHFGLDGMGVAPAGTKKANTGHFHLLIDTDLPPLQEPIPNDENHLHFGGGQTEVELSLPPGPHTLQLLLGDADHIPHTPPVYSDKIHVTAMESLPAPIAAAQPPAAGIRHPSPPDARVYIVSPENGAYVPTTFTVRFGLEKMGVAPAGIDKPNSGHHHLLIDAPLPPLDKPIPNDENHLHFGGGQTEATLTLPMGRHTLQLLLGDAFHLPHEPPIYSNPIVVYVGLPPPAAPAPAAQAPAPGTRHPSPPGARVYIVSPDSGAYVPTTFTVRFGLEKMGIAPAGVDKPNSGHHHLLIDAPLPPLDKPIPNDENHLHFGGGQTETTLTLPTGRHSLQLLLGDAFHLPHEPPVYSNPIVVYVGMTPPPVRHHRPFHHHQAA